MFPWLIAYPGLLTSELGEMIHLQITDITVNTHSTIDCNQIRKSNMNDPTMVRLARVSQQGWPETGKELCDDVKNNFPYRFALHIANGIIFLHGRVVIPIGLRQMFLSKIHDTHLGIVKSKLLGRNLIFWPNWKADVKRYVKHMTYADKIK